MARRTKASQEEQRSDGGGGDVVARAVRMAHAADIVRGAAARIPAPGTPEHAAYQAEVDRLKAMPAIAAAIAEQQADHKQAAS